MVDKHYRWDFIGLSTDSKPTPATSSKVVNGSTYYTSDNSKLYVWYKDRWYEKTATGGGGGGGSYTAGDGIDITNDVISVDTTTIQEKLTAGDNITISDNTISATDTTYTAGTNITISDGEISATDTTYSNFVGTDGSSAGTAGLVPAPATTDAGKFLKADGTWDTAGGGGGGDTVYSDKTTSDQSAGGAVYIGNLDSSQSEQSDPTSTDNHYKYFWVLPYSNTTIPGNNSINILGKSFNLRSNQVTIGSQAQAENSSVAIGLESLAGNNSVSIGASVNSQEGGSFNNYGNYVSIGTSSRARNNGVSVGYEASAMSDHTVALGNAAQAYQVGSVALGAGAYPTRAGEVCIKSDSTGYGFNNTNYRVIGGVHDGQELHDAATVAQGNTLSTSAPTTSTVGVLGQLWTDTTNMHTYQCTAISGSTYTWTQRW